MEISNQVILHHTANSIFAEKIRLMLDYSEIDWLSVEATTNMVDRKIQSILVEGYSRRIPLLQIGADIYCDSSVITKKIAELSGNDNLDKDKVSGREKAFFEYNETAMFLAEMGAFKISETLRGYAHNIPLNEVVDFLRGRLGAISSLEDKRKALDTKNREKNIIAKKEYYTQMNEMLQNSQYLFSDDQPTLADFGAYELVWYEHRMEVMDDFSNWLNLERWYNNMHVFRTNRSLKIDPVESLRIAKKHQPLPIPEHMQKSKDIGRALALRPDDYGEEITLPVTGILVGEDDVEYILERETTETGKIHVHFPKRALGACL